MSPQLNLIFFFAVASKSVHRKQYAVSLLHYHIHVITVNDLILYANMSGEEGVVTFEEL